MINKEFKIIFTDIPKTGSTSVITCLNQWFRTITDKDLFYDTDGSLISKRHSKIKEDLKSIQNQNEYFSFTFVRNPWDRLVSYFLFMKQFSKNKHIHASLTLENALDPHYFENLKKQKAKGRGSLQILLTNQLDYCEMGGKLRHDHIGRFENIDKDFAIICKKILAHLGLPEDKYPLPELPKTNKTKRKSYDKYFNSKSLERANIAYKKDINFFNYKFEGNLVW
jgi:chondroitin 4-sulfotransferase 11